METRHDIIASSNNCSRRISGSSLTSVAIMKDGKVEIEAKGVKAGHFAVEVDVGMVVVEVLVVGQVVGASAVVG